MRHSMKRHAPQLIALVLALASGRAAALDTAALLDDPSALKLLSKQCIRAEAYGVMPVPFAAAEELLGTPDLIKRIQNEYRRSVSKNGTVDFPVEESGPGTFYYLNEKDQRTDIRELCRRPTSDATFDLVYLAAGKRFFGDYEVLIHIRAIDAGTAGTVYTAEINAYPHNLPMRFLTRWFGSTERYFQRKTALTARIATRICADLSPPANANPTYPYRRIESAGGLR